MANKQQYLYKFLIFLLVAFNLAIQAPNASLNATLNNTIKSKHQINKENKIQAIIWDLNGTLLEANELSAAWEIGFAKFLKHALFDRQNVRSLKNNIKKDVFKFLNSIYQSTQSKISLLTPDGMAMPDIMVDWQKGIITGKEVCNLVDLNINDREYSHCFISNYHKNLIHSACKSMFNPKKLSKKLYRIKSTISLLKNIAQQKNKKGKSKYKLFVLSNFDKQTLNEFTKTREGKKIFKYFHPENIVISANIGLVKPETEIYTYFLKKYNLDAKNCLFIDDQKENIQAAQKIGIKSILIENKNYKALKNDLQNLSIIN